jgi:lysophospholipase L1-like esterase
LKKILRRIRITILSLILLVLSVTLGVYIFQPAPQSPVTTLIPPKLNVYAPISDNVKALGRTYYEDGVRYLSHSGSGIEFLCRGEYAVINLKDDSEGRYSNNHKPRYAVYKNGEVIIQQVLSQTDEAIHITLDGYEADSVITLIKLSEAQYSAMGVGEIAVYGKSKIVPTQEKPVKIEFIGDSITCGYGIDEENPKGYFKTETENFAKSYAYLTAEKLGADYSAVCFSGFGVYSGYTTGGVRNSQDVVPAYYDKSCFLYGGRETYWDFGEFQSDIIVINLGTNDASYCGSSLSGRQEFTRRYAEFIKQVRMCNPYAYILCMLGDMNNTMYSCIESAVSNYINETADHRIKAETVSYRMDVNDIVIDGHPGYLSNKCAADDLSVKIAQLTNAYN